MRNGWFDRSAAERRLGVRQAMVAAWAVVFLLFGLVFIVPGIAGTAAHAPATPDRAIVSLVAHAVPQDADSCRCDDYDRLAMAPSPSLC
jgi:hypothetical protein